MNVEGSLDKAYEYSCRAAYDQAVAEYDAILARDPGNAFARYQRGYCHAARRDFPRALADFLRAIQADPGQLYEYRRYIVHMLREVQLDSDAEQLLHQHGFGSVIHSLCAERYRSAGQFDRELGALTEVLKRATAGPNEGYTLYLRGNCYLELRNFTAAIADYDAALAAGYTGYGNAVASQRALALRKQQKK
jgi:tetratricopeptide (TPR) repeat protein